MENTTAIYYGTATEARQAGALDQYRASAAMLRETRDSIDAAISASFDGFRLSRRCMDDVLQSCSAEAVAIILAVTLEGRRYDGRFSQENKSWGTGIRQPGAAGGDRGCWFECRTHSAILDGFINLFRQRQQ